MKIVVKRLVLLFVCLLFMQTIVQAQTKEIDQEKWETIVNYVNSKATLQYLTFLSDNKKLNKKDSEEFTQNIRNPFNKNKIESSMSFHDISNLLDENFKETRKKLSSPINNLKETKNLDSLFTSLKKIFIEVKAAEVYDSKEIKESKKKTEKYLTSSNAVKQTKTKPQVPQTFQQVDHTPQKGLSSIPWWGWLLVAFFIILLIILLIQNRSLHKINHKLKREKEREKSGSVSYREQDKIRFNNKIETLNNDNERLKKEIRRLNTSEEKKFTSEEKPTSPINLDISTPSRIPDKIFYAGKPTTEKELTAISGTKETQSTIYKLETTNAEQTRASFEVILASDFMKINITNAPDDYLYRICDHENSNQEFRKEIITIKKGTAEFINGKWMVKEENKALIKFQ